MDLNQETNAYLEVLLAFRRDRLTAFEAVEQIRGIQVAQEPADPEDLATTLDRIEAGVRAGRLNTYQDGRPTLRAVYNWLSLYGPIRLVQAKGYARVYWVDRMGLTPSADWRAEQHAAETN